MKAPRLLALALALMFSLPTVLRAETRLLGASYKHDMFTGLTGNGDHVIGYSGADKPWHGHQFYIYPTVTGQPPAPESEAWGDVTPQLLPDGFYLDTRLRSRILLTGFYSNSLRASSSVEYTFRLEVIGQNETFTFDQPVMDRTDGEPGSNALLLINSPTGGQATIPYTTILSPGLYTIRIYLAVFDTTGSHDWHFNHATGVHFTNFTIARGAFQHVPHLPGPGGSFGGLHGGGWFDPPMAQGYTFTATGTALFKEIMAFPEGIPGSYYVTTEGTTYGPYAPDATVNFQALRGHGVSSFVLKGIKPFVDATNPTAFPIMLDFTEETADFTMVPIAAPDCTLERLPNGDVRLTFTGVLQSSLNLTTWTDVTPAPTSPFVIPQAQVAGAKFFRSRDP